MQEAVLDCVLAWAVDEGVVGPHKQQDSIRLSKGSNEIICSS